MGHLPEAPRERFRSPGAPAFFVRSHVYCFIHFGSRGC